MAVYTVPTDYADIATAIADAAASGDTIQLESAHSPFTGANNTTNWPGDKDIIFEGDTENPFDTVIDCEDTQAYGFYFNGANLAAASIARYLRITQATSHGVYYRHNGGNAQYDLHHVVIDNCNTPSSGGAAVIVNDTGDGMTWFDCLFYSNISTGQEGGAIRILGTTINIESCTFAYNSATGYIGGAIMNVGPNTVSIKDSIFWGNIAASQGAQIGTRYNGTTLLNYCCYRNLAGDIWTESGSTFTPTNCTTADPLFAVGPDGDYYLGQEASGQGADSSCLDAGSDTAVNIGLDDRTTRTDSVADEGQVDMGWHYVPALPPSPTEKLMMMQQVP